MAKHDDPTPAVMVFDRSFMRAMQRESEEFVALACQGGVFLGKPVETYEIPTLMYQIHLQLAEIVANRR